MLYGTDRQRHAATATGVAVGRALASRGSNPLIDDPFVRAVGVEFFTRMAAGELDPEEVEDNAVFSMRGGWSR
jgi:O-methyltransferase involved in polyketide biosynthesis